MVAYINKLDTAIVIIIHLTAKRHMDVRNLKQIYAKMC